VSGPTLADIVDLFDRYGAQRYDEELMQRSHAEQTAANARAAGASDALVAASLLHDIGHLLELAERDGPRDRTTDQRHEAQGSAWLASLFPPSVTAPIALHVRAKRYRVTVDPSYAAVLSAGSIASLQRQGGELTAVEVEAFESNPGWEDAVALRGWDDQAKDLTITVPGFATYLPLLESLLLP
jgi:predicted HD phosphohydrolase